jgi:Fe-S cluster assembly protein SufD
LVKTSLDHQAKSFFTGNIHVPQDSQQIKASQMTKNLLLSKQTQSINQPQLEVYADDVECAHGSTTGSLDHDQLFYLTSRGIEKNKAIQMLSQGFVLDLVNQVDSEWIKKELLEFINQREQ